MSGGGGGSSSASGCGLSCTDDDAVDPAQPLQLVGGGGAPARNSFSSCCCCTRPWRPSLGVVLAACSMDGRTRSATKTNAAAVRRRRREGGMESCMRAYYTCCSPVLRCLGFLLALVSVCWCSWCVVVLALQGRHILEGGATFAASFIYRRGGAMLCACAAGSEEAERERLQAFRWWWNAVQDDRQPASTSVVRRRVEGLEDTAGLGWAGRALAGVGLFV